MMMIILVYSVVKSHQIWLQNKARYEVVELLLKIEIINAKDSEDRIALMWAVKESFKEVEELLKIILSPRLVVKYFEIEKKNSKNIR